MGYCSKCGFFISPSDNFCSSCGTRNRNASHISSFNSISAFQSSPQTTSVVRCALCGGGGDGKDSWGRSGSFPCPSCKGAGKHRIVHSGKLEICALCHGHGNARDGMGGVVYPQILVCLCLANDADGYKQTLEYISGLKPESKIPVDRAKVSNFLRVFHLYNAKLNTVEKLQKDIQLKLAKVKTQKSKLAKR